MEGLVDAGLVRHIGVSNFGLRQLEELLGQARIKPVVNQVGAESLFLSFQIGKYPHGQRQLEELLAQALSSPWSTRCGRVG